MWWASGVWEKDGGRGGGHCPLCVGHVSDKGAWRPPLIPPPGVTDSAGCLKADPRSSHCPSSQVPQEMSLDAPLCYGNRCRWGRAWAEPLLTVPAYVGAWLVVPLCPAEEWPAGEPRGLSPTDPCTDLPRIYRTNSQCAHTLNVNSRILLKCSCFIRRE